MTRYEYEGDDEGPQIRPDPWKGRRHTGGSRKRWTYGYPDLARALHMTEAAVRQAAKRRKFNPADLSSILAYAQERQKRKGRS